MRVCIGSAWAVILAVAAAAAGAAAEEGAGLAAGLQLALSTYRQCEAAAGGGGDAAGADALACLKTHALRALRRALAGDKVPLAEGLALVRAGSAAEEESPAAAEAAAEAEAEAEAAAVAAAGGGAGERRQARLDALLAAHASRLLRSRALAVSVPRVLAALLPEEEAADDEAPQEEGRRQGGLGGLGGLGGKRRGGKKGHGAMLLAMLMKGSMIAYAYKALAVMAGKALLVAKVALVLASVMGLSHLVGHKAPATTYEIVKQPVVHGYHQLDDHHHFDVADLHGHGGGFGGGGGGAGGGAGGGSGGWGRAGVGRSLSAGAAPAAPPPASPPPASQLVAPEAAATTPEAAEAAAPAAAA